MDIKRRRLIGWSNTGLGDRMAAISRTIDVAKIFDVGPAFLWQYNDNLHCDFYTLFDNRDIEVIHEKPPHTLSVRHSAIYPYMWAYHKDVVIETYSTIKTAANQNPTLDVSNILINHKLMAQAEIEATRLHTFNRLGIHVRRGDLISNKFLPKSFVKERLLPEITFFNWIEENHPNAPLFLATESRQVEKNFRARYGERVVTREKKSYVRHNPQGIKDAMVDMLLLAQCNNIVGPLSMFSRCAAKLGGIEYAQIC